MTRCPCGVPTRDQTFVCDICLASLEHDLAEIPSLLIELTTALARQVRLGERVGSRSADTPLPFGWNASVTLQTAALTLQAWFDVATSKTRASATRASATMALHLARSGDWFRTHPDGPQAYEELRWLVREMRNCVDLPPFRLYAGPCGTRLVETELTCDDNGVIGLTTTKDTTCGISLWAIPGSATITCRDCRASYPAQGRRDWLLSQVHDALLPLRDVWAALPTLVGCQPSWDTVSRWAGRRLDVRGHTADGVQLFRGGDILTLAQYDPRRVRTRTRVNVMAGIPSG